MQKNEYRRALIMLRSLLNGYSGHARMEIRTLTGNINIRATVPQGAQSVRAALVGRRSSLYYACPLGDLRRDMRGQAGLSVNLDPRDICGRTLDAYSLLALATISNGVCELALVGNLNGSCENDWSRVRDAVCALYAPQPRLEEAPMETPEAAPGEVPESAAGGEDADISGADPAEEGIVWGYEEETAQEDAPEGFEYDGKGYVPVKLPEGCGYEYAYVGAAGGEVCVALPGGSAAEPPAGLDDYIWTEIGGRGWWVKCYQPAGAENEKY